MACLPTNQTNNLKLREMNLTLELRQDVTYVTDCNKKIWWNNCSLRHQPWKRHSHPASSLCSEALCTRCKLPCICVFKQNYPQFVWLRAFSEFCTGLTFNLKEKGQGKVSGDKHGDETEDKWGHYSRKCINLKSDMKVACALHIALSFLLVLLKAMRNPAEVPVRSDLEQTLSSHPSGEFPRYWWSDHL